MLKCKAEERKGVRMSERVKNANKGKVMEAANEVKKIPDNVMNIESCGKQFKLLSVCVSDWKYFMKASLRRKLAKIDRDGLLCEKMKYSAKLMAIQEALQSASTSLIGLKDMFDYLFKFLDSILNSPT